MQQPTSAIRLTAARGLASAYAVVIFLSAFLLFQVQPLIGKCILPWFGGSPAVWTTCMLVFQLLLFGGYAYAHWTTRHLTVRKQAWLHCGLTLQDDRSDLHGLIDIANDVDRNAADSPSGVKPIIWTDNRSNLLEVMWQ